MTTMQEWQERLDAVRIAVESGSVETASRATLMQYNGWLSHANAPMHFARNYDQVCETVRLHLMRSMIEGIEERNKTMQWLVIALAVAALLSAVVQTIVTVMAYVKPPKVELVLQPIAPSPPVPSAQSVVPIPAKPPSSRPAHTAPPAKQQKDGAQKP